ncbi:MAG: cob(I)yrinic acid a,c-diamide adenosyltransferase [Deltaproteobacteria bacterium]|nr:cob(I)yrinic acid a,c-diamide adenosyltransferase [Deltaproteobacteria bacterium]MBN2670940.1 cob(I)yrinic acid a,c-diamide adenosyltransferase [Deltaproteobacteria bacterium]
MKSTIYTRTGDRGTTSLADGTTLPKYALRLEAYGTIDEANAHVGLAMATIRDIVGDDTDSGSESALCAPFHDLYRKLHFLSNRLFNCSSLLAHGTLVPPLDLRLSVSDVAILEQSIDVFDEQSGALHGFILCGGTTLAARLHIARTVIRRAERLVCRLFEEDGGDETVFQFINRTSDFLFAAARYANFLLGERDVLWQKSILLPEIS